MQKNSIDSLFTNADEETIREISEKVSDPFDADRIFRSSYAKFKGEQIQSKMVYPVYKRKTFRVMTAAACLLMTVGLSIGVWSKQQRIEIRPPQETETTTVTQTETRTETTAQVTTESLTTEQQTEENTTKLETTVTSVLSSKQVQLSTSTTTILPMSSATKIEPSTATQTECQTTTIVPALPVSAESSTFPKTSAIPDIVVIPTPISTVIETMMTTGSVTTQTAPVTETDSPKIDTQQIVTASAGFYVSYCVGVNETQFIRFQPGENDPSDFSETYELQTEGLTMQPGEVLFIGGKLCRVFMIEDSQRTYELIQYRRCDFCYTCHPETEWEFRRFLDDIPSFFGIGENRDADGDCIWEDGLYVMYVQAPRDTAEQIVRGFRTETEGQEELS